MLGEGWVGRGRVGEELAEVDILLATQATAMSGPRLQSKTLTLSMALMQLWGSVLMSVSPVMHFIMESLVDTWSLGHVGLVL